MKLYKFHWDCGREGDLSGMFIVSAEGERILKAMVGEQLEFGEALGRKSDVSGTLDEVDLSVVDATQDDLEAVCRVMFGGPLGDCLWGTLSGFCPLDYIGESGIDFDALKAKAGVA